MSAEVSTIPALHTFLDSCWFKPFNLVHSNDIAPWLTAPVAVYDPPVTCNSKMDPDQPNPTPDESTELASEFQTQLDLFLKLGFSQTQVRAAFLKLGLSADTNKVLGELIQAGVEPEEPTGFPVLVPRGDGSSKARSAQTHSRNTPEELVEDEDSLRPIVIDGSNVAMR